MATIIPVQSPLSLLPPVPAQALSGDLCLDGAVASVAGPAEHRSRGKSGPGRQPGHRHAPGKSRKQSGRGPAPAISRHGTAPAARRRQKPFCWRRCQGSRYNSSGSSASPYRREIGSMLTISHNKATGKNLIYALGSLMESKPCGFYSVSHLDGFIIIEQKVF